MSFGIKIGELAARCGVSRDTLRFYERVGLLPSPQRTVSGHRIYDQEAAQRLEFIRHSQQLGLTLDDIRELLRMQELPEREAYRRVAERLRARIQTIEQQLATLQTYRQRLARSVELVEGVPRGASPVELLLGLSEVSSGRGDDA